MNEEIKNSVSKTITLWEKGWALGSPKIIASVYTEECIFYSTIGSDLITSSLGVRKYFEETFSSVQGVTASVETLHWVQSTDTFVTVGGMLYFDLIDRQKIPARVVWGFRKESGKWLINSHHSSIIARSLPT